MGFGRFAAVLVFAGGAALPVGLLGVFVWVLRLWALLWLTRGGPGQ